MSRFLNMKKITAILLSVMMILSLGAVTFAASPGKQYSASLAQAVSSPDVAGVNDNAELKESVYAQLADCKTEIDILSFGIGYNNENAIALRDMIISEWPEISFNLAYDTSGNVQTYNFSFSSSGNKISKIGIKNGYVYSKQEYAAKLAACNSAAAEITDGVAQSGFSQAQQVLIIHDRLAARVAYDTGLNAYNNSDITGALLDGLAVCTGYSSAMRFVLSKIGITATLCSSDTLNHVWNVVTVDGLKYHVDVTWDDVVPDVLGRVHHNYLLKSTSCLLNDSAHSASDFTDTSPVSTAYDNWLLNNSLSNAVFINGRLFFINNADKTLREYFPNGGVSVIKNLNPNWGDGSISYMDKLPGSSTDYSFARLSDDGDLLLYSEPDGIYAYNTADGTFSKVYSAPFSRTAMIYGFSAENGKLSIQLANMTDLSNITFTFSEYTYSSQGDDPGVDNPGGDNPGGDTPGGDNPGTDNPDYPPAPAPAVDIVNYTSSRSVRYDQTIVFRASAQNVPAGAAVCFFLNGENVGQAETFRVTARGDFSVQAKVMKGGEVLASSRVEKVSCDSGIFSRIVSFFLKLFGALPEITQ